MAIVARTKMAGRVSVNVPFFFFIIIIIIIMAVALQQLTQIYILPLLAPAYAWILREGRQRSVGRLRVCGLGLPVNKAISLNPKYMHGNTHLLVSAIHPGRSRAIAQRGTKAYIYINLAPYHYIC